MLVVFGFVQIINSQDKTIAKGFLENAINASKNKDSNSYNLNMLRFQSYIDEEQVTAESLPKEYLDLYVNALYFPIMNEIEMKSEYQKKALEFLMYGNYDDPLRYYTIAYIYENGLGTSKDNNQAIQWYQKAAKKGNDIAMGKLADLFVQKDDYQNAMFWMEKTFDNSDRKDLRLINAKMLSHLYKNGIGTTIDYDKALFWFEKAIENSYDITKDAETMVELAGMYSNYRSKQYKDYTKARYWYEKAANLGSKTAYMMLGYIYQKGEGVNVDLEKAKKYFEMSCKNKCKVSISKNSLKIK